MPSASKMSTPVAVDLDEIQGRYAPLGDYTVAFETFKEDADPAPFFVGLPDDRCQCEHWGVVMEGQLTFRWADREETYVPLVSETWQPGQPIHVFFRAIKEEGDEPGRLLYHKEPTAEGLVAGGLPWEVRRRFELVDHKPAPDAIVVDFQAKPDHQDLAIGYVCVPAGLLIALVTGLMWFSKPTAAREGEAPAEPLHQ